MRRFIRSAKSTVDLLNVTEIALGTTAGILLAGALGLQYSAVAGITTLLTIQNTRGTTLKTALHRILAFVLMVLLSAVTLLPLRFHVLGFGVFLLLFVGGCYLLDLQNVIASNAVLATHFLIEKSMAPGLIINEFGLLMIGTLTGMLVKLIIPRRPAPLAEFRDDIEDSFRTILRSMARKTRQILSKQEEQDILLLFDALEGKLTAYEDAALFERDNHLLTERKYPVAYFQMRSRQASFLRRIWQHLARTEQGHETNFLLADFFNEVADGFTEANTAIPMLETLEKIDHAYDRLPLPRHRKEFEDRAMLYAVMQDLRSLLEIKRDFAYEAMGESRRYRW